MGGDSIVALLSELPGDGMTVKLLEALDFLVPGQWENTTDIEAMVKREVGETHPGAELEMILVSGPRGLFQGINL